MRAIGDPATWPLALDAKLDPKSRWNREPSRRRRSAGGSMGFVKAGLTRGSLLSIHGLQGALTK